MECVLVTAPRTESYLMGTWHHLCAQGFRPFILDDASWGNGVSRLGITPMFKRALARLDAEWVVVFQDDVRLTFTASELREILNDKSGVVSLFLSPGRVAPEGWSRVREKGYPINLGACGLCVDASTKEKILKARPFQRTDRLGSQLCIWCRQNEVPFWVHHPSLIEHVGEVSCRS